MSKSLPWSSIVHSCYRGNRAATSVVTAMLVTHRLLRTWTAMVDVYVALTEFSRQKFIEGGIPSEKIVVKPNFVPDPGLGGGRGEYALYAGRLSPEKGIDLLLAAWEQMGKKIPLKIVGDGPLADKVAAAAESIAGVEWLGHQPLEQVYTLLREAAFLVFPSEWYEGLPRILVEAFAVGTPAIVADLGSMKSLVSPYHTGLQFQAGDATDLAAKVEWLLEHPAAMARMRLEARSEFEAKYTAIKNYQKLLEIYSLASA